MTCTRLTPAFSRLPSSHLTLPGSFRGLPSVGRRFLVAGILVWAAARHSVPPPGSVLALQPVAQPHSLTPTLQSPSSCEPRPLTPRHRLRARLSLPLSSPFWPRRPHQPCCCPGLLSFCDNHVSQVPRALQPTEPCHKAHSRSPPCSPVPGTALPTRPMSREVTCRL